MKVVKVSELNRGDHFVFADEAKGVNPYVYVVTDADVHKWIDCVCVQTGKDFAVGPSFDVVPVALKIGIKYATEEKVLDLTRKCGSCEYASTKDKKMYKHLTSYVRCVCPSRRFREEISAYRARTTKCCKCYKPKESADE